MATTAKTCPEGYELNPSTNRCRKIRKSITNQYPVEEITEGNYDNPQIFIATWALIALGVGVVAYVVIQFRREIARSLKHAKLLVCRRKKS